jgi:hypothetical protein
MSATDHLLVRNTVVDTGTNSGSVGLLLTYMTQEWTDRNNGVRATVLSNVVDGFDYGVFMESGTNGVSNPTSNHLVEVTFHLNDIDHSSACALFTTGITWTVNATTNWLGSYADPSNLVSAAVDYRYWPLGRFYTDTDHDGVMDAYDGDDDADGLSDTAELSIGAMPDRWDTDMDGMNDGAEWIVAGTDPKNPLSVLHLLSIASVSASQFAVKWSSVAGRWYAVSRTTNINVKSWIVLTNRMAATAPTNSFVDATAIGVGPYYYRVSVTNQ